MCRVITHRGPDEQGTAIEGRAAMGMRRLSIIDLATGQQPIYNDDRTKLIVFNGEIYNYRELKKDLESRGLQISDKLRHRDDHSRLRRIWRGLLSNICAECLLLRSGMSASRVLFIARDRVGKKPLFYTVTDEGEFVFGSEMKVLLEHGGVKREIDHGALDSYLTFGYVPEELCIFKGVKKARARSFS